MNVNKKNGIKILALFASFFGGLSAAIAQQSSVFVITGTVNNNNYRSFERFISNNLNKIVGVRVLAEKLSGSPSIDVNCSDRFYLYGKMGSSEILSQSAYSFQHGYCILDGFFVVKYGGHHFGIDSYGLEKTDEGAVRIRAKIIEIPLK